MRKYINYWIIKAILSTTLLPFYKHGDNKTPSDQSFLSSQHKKNTISTMSIAIEFKKEWQHT